MYVKQNRIFYLFLALRAGERAQLAKSLLGKLGPEFDLQHTHIIAR